MKHFYKQSHIDSMVSLNVTSIVLVHSCMKIAVDMLSNTELDKIFYAIHQMSYSVYNQVVQNSLNNKTSNLTNIFLLRTSSLVILISSNWREHDFVKLLTEYFKQWYKIIAREYELDIKTIVPMLLNLVKCLCIILSKETDNETQRLGHLLWNALYLLLIILRRDSSSNDKNYIETVKYIRKFLAPMKDSFEVLLSLHKVDSILSSKKQCFCQQNKDISGFIDLLNDSSRGVYTCEEMNLTISYIFHSHLKNNEMMCTTVTDLLKTIANKFLTWQKSMHADELDDVKKEMIFLTCILAQRVLRYMEMSQQVESNKGKCKNWQKKSR